MESVKLREELLKKIDNLNFREKIDAKIHSLLNLLDCAIEDENELLAERYIMSIQSIALDELIKRGE